MATGSINLNANLTLNTQSLNAASKQAQQALGRITGQASEFQKSLDASTARVFAFGATTTILNGVSQAFSALISNTIEVERRINEIGSILGGTSDQLNQLRDSVFAVAKDTGQAFGIVADAAAELARQGLSAEDTSKRLSAALILTRVSGLDSVKSVKALTSAINGFTSAGLTAEQITNKLVAVDTKFAVSAQDLADGFSRAGSTAEDAGVSFDELLGIITAVEQKTARGGAVIGNALKSIFARLGRAKVIDDLKELGVEIDSSQTGIQKLQALSASLERIADPTVANQIKELAGGVFQINVVSAALKDLGSDTSIFAAAAKTAAGATNEAFTKNAQLNESISSQINSLIVGLVNLSEKIGTITFGPIVKNLLSLANTFSTFLEEALDPEKGNKFIQGLLKTIGAFLSGPGLILITTAFLKIFTLVAKFAKEGFKTILDIGSQSEKIKSIEGGIVGLLSRDQQLRTAIVNTTISQADKQAAIIAAIQRENALLTQQEQLLRSIATAAAQRGVAGYSSSGGFSGKGGKRFAEGYMAEEATARMLGASPSVKAKQGKGTIGGRKFIMNNQETEIPNFGRNGDSAVIPHYAKGFVPNFAKYIYDSDRIAPDKNATLKAILASKARKNLIVGPAGSGKSTFAAKGGNFLSGVSDVPKTGANEIDILSSSARAKDGGFSKNFQEIISSVNASGGKVSYLYTKNLDILNRREGRTEASEGDLRSQKQLKGTKFAPLNQFDFISKIKSGSKSFGLLKNAAQGFVPNFAANVIPEGRRNSTTGYFIKDGKKPLTEQQTEFNNNLSNQKTLNKTGSVSTLSDDEKKQVLANYKAIDVNSLVKPMPTVLTPNDNSKNINYNQEYDKTNGVVLNYKFNAFAASNKAGLTENFKTNFGSDEIEAIARTNIINQSKVIAEALGMNPAEPDTVDEIVKGEGFKGAIRSASGALFEAAVSTTLKLGTAENKKDQGNFDVRNPKGNGKEKLKELFGESSMPAPVADFKYSADSTKQSMAGKVYREYRGKIDPKIDERRKQVKGAFEKALEKKEKQNGVVNAKNVAGGIKVKGRASGFIPNYANPKYISDTLKRIKEGNSGFSKNEQETFKNKFEGAKSLPASSSKDAKISLRQVFDNLDSEIGISNFVDKAYSSAGPTASTEKVFQEFDKQTKLNPAPLRNIVKSKGFVPNFAINGLDANLSNNVLAGRIFEALLRNEKTINMTENKVGPDITSGAFAVREAKISGKSAYNDSNFGEGKPKGKGLVLPSNAISDYDDKLITLKQADILRSNIPTTRLFGLAAEIKKREEDKVTNRNSVPIYAPKGLVTRGASKIKGLKGFASGYIPNFANPLKDAISREVGAGVNPSQVYVDQNSSLKNSGNPMGLMVANRRDEPAGGFQGIARARKEGANAQTYGAAKGFIPNFAGPMPNRGVKNTAIQITKALGVGLIKQWVDERLGDGFVDNVERIGLQLINPRNIAPFLTELNKPTKSKHQRAFDTALMSDPLMQAQFPQRYRQLQGQINTYNRDNSASGGFMPNFANPLKDAISREIGAGVEPSKVYVDQNNSLKNPMNPAGLMVANRRDEPQGGFQGVNRAKKEGANIKTYGMARGFIPNFAEPDGGDPNKLANFNKKIEDVDTSINTISKSLDSVKASLPSAPPVPLASGLGDFPSAEMADYGKKVQESGAKLEPLNVGATEAAKALSAIKPPDIGATPKPQDFGITNLGPPEEGAGGLQSSIETLGEAFQNRDKKDEPEPTKPAPQKVGGGAPTVNVGGKNMPVGASNSELLRARGKAAGLNKALPMLPAVPSAQIAKARTAVEAVPKGGAGMGGMGGMKSLVLQAGLSALPSLLPAIKEEDGALKSAAISTVSTTAQYTAMGATFGPVGAALGAVAGLAMSGYNAFKEASDAAAKAQKDLAESTIVVNAKMKGLDRMKDLTRSALGLSKVFDDNGNQTQESADALRNGYKSIISTYESSGVSSKEITDAQQKAKAVLQSSTSSEEEKTQAEGEYTAILGNAMTKLSQIINNRAEQAQKLLNFQALSSALSKFSAILEKKAVTLDQQKFAEGIASNVTMPANAPYAEATKAAIGIEQKKTLATESKVGFMKEFTGEDFQKNLNMDSIKMDKLKGKSGAEVSGAISKDVFSAYMKDGAIGAGKALDEYLKTNLKPEDAKAFKDSVISSAQTFRNNVAESMQAALNRETEVKNNLSELVGKIKEAGTKFMAGGSGKVNELMSGPKLDVLSLQDKIEEAGRLLKSGKAGDVEKGRDILRQTDGDQKEFAKRYGDEKLVQMQTDAGLTSKDTGLAIGSASMAATDLSGVEKAIRDTFTGGELMETMKALKAAQGDPTKIQNFIDTLKKNSVTGSEKKAERGGDIVNSLSGLGKTGSTEKEIAAALAKKQITPERAEKLRERAKKESEGATATEDPESKALQGKQKELNAELGTLKTKIAELTALFGDTGIPLAVKSLTKSVTDAANNLAGFTDFTKNLSSLSDKVNGRLIDIEKKLGQAGQ